MDYISKPALMGKLTSSEEQKKIKGMTGEEAYNEFLMLVNSEEKADVEPVRHEKLYNAHEVAEIIVKAIGDTPVRGR